MLNVTNFPKTKLKKKNKSPSSNNCSRTKNTTVLKSNSNLTVHNEDLGVKKLSGKFQIDQTTDKAGSDL